jgi:hypothetical protein
MLIFALIAIYTPNRLPGAVQRSLQVMTNQFSTRTVLLIIGILISIYAFIASWIRRATMISDPFPEADSGAVTRDVAIAGKQLTTKFNRQRDERLNLTDSNTKALKSELKSSLADLYTHTHKFETRETARNYIESGQWTSDQYAAAFLTESATVDYPLRHRVYAWLYPGSAYEMRVRRTLRAIESKYMASDMQYDPSARTHSGPRKPGSVADQIAGSQSVESE